VHGTRVLVQLLATTSTEAQNAITLSAGGAVSLVEANGTKAPTASMGRTVTIERLRSRRDHESVCQSEGVRATVPKRAGAYGGAD